MKTISTRRAALQVLHKIVENGVKASVALDHADMPEAERGLLHELVYGVLRRWYSLEADFSRFCRAKPDVWAQLGLLLGTYQIRHMRIPDYAAVGETVDAVKIADAHAAGYVNAVLRKVADHDAPIRLKPYQRAELPRWLFGEWRDAFGADVVEDFSMALQVPPKLSVAVFGERKSWMDAVQAQGISAEAGALSEHAVLLPAGTPVAYLPGYQDGAFTVMDQAAQAAVMAMPKVHNEAVILDLCASPGGKTALLAHRFPRARIIALELNARRIPRLLENIERLKLGNVRVLQGDAGGLSFPDGSVDAIFLDAPCSASGVLRRHPDAKFLHDAASVALLANQQLAMAKESLRVLKTGGRMVYGVCSIHPAENERVMDQLVASKGVEMTGSSRIFPSLVADGFFFATLKKLI